ncbi:MAG: PulJ/GspJ family protein, partial [Pseudonocardiaceae bacterium]
MSRPRPAPRTNWSPGFYRRSTTESGFTLIELLVAMTLLMVMTGAVVVTVTTAFRVTADNHKRVVASGIVAQTLDLLRATSFSTINAQDNGVHTWSTVDNNVTYTVVQQIKPTPPPGGSPDTCSYSSSGTNGAFLSATVTVSWPQSGAAAAQGKTILAPPAGIINSNDSGVILQVVGGDGITHPNPALPITISPAPSGQLAVPTDSNGCASFAFLPTGSGQQYTLTAAGSGTWYTPQQKPASVTTAPGQPTLSEQWDRAATLVATLQTTGSFPTSCSVSGAPCGWTHYPVIFIPTQPSGGNVAGGDGTAVTAFPFYNSPSAPGVGYRAHVGDCSDSDPGVTYDAPFTSRSAG